MALPRALRHLTQVFLKTPCAICQRSASNVLCSECYQQLLSCQWLDSTQKHIATPGTLALSTEAEMPVFPWGQYRGLLKQALAQLKYGDYAELGVWLGVQLGQSWCNSKHDNGHHPQPVVVPIPLHDQRLKQRGYNQAALIARGFCRVTGFSLAEHGLIRTKATAAMHSLGIYERRKNVTAAFQLGKALPTSRPILLIDDIYTTGTTADAATSPLVNAGYTIIGIATVARPAFSTPRFKPQGPSPSHQTPNSHPAQ